MGIDNSQALQHKKSAREIFAEAFMDEDTFTKSTRFVDYADEEELKATYEKEKRAKQMAAEAEADPNLDEVEDVSVDALD